ncbi:MAG: hypothetical protein AAFW69_02645 [Pseudomonadota bacterium]
MPAPIALAPLALTALRVGAVAAAGLAAWRLTSRPGLPEDRRETALDTVEEGLEMTRAAQTGEGRTDAAARVRRVIRLGPGGPGVEIDAAALARIRLRRVR